MQLSIPKSKSVDVAILIFAYYIGKYVYSDAASPYFIPK